MKEYIVSVDIAKKADYTGVQIFRQVPLIREGKKLLGQRDMKMTKYDLVYMTKIQGLNYNVVAEKILRIITLDNLLGNSDLIVDGSGVGEAVIDIMRGLNMNPISIVFTGGDLTREVYDTISNVFSNSSATLGGMKVLKQINVPKKDMVDCAVVALQQGLIRLSPNIKYREEFLDQLSKFKGKINEKGNVRYEADKESTHDDLVACFLMFCWWQHYNQPRELEEIEEQHTNNTRELDFNLFD